MSRFDDTDKLHSMTEVLPWMFLADDGASVVVNKDSSLLAAWALYGVDIESGDSFALDEAAARFDAILRRLADYPVALWTRVDREPVNEYAAGAFDNQVAQFIDNEWAAEFEAGAQFSNRQSIAISMSTAGAALSIGEMTRENIDAGQKPAKAVFNALRSRFGGQGARFGFRTRDELDQVVRRFEQTVCAPFEQSAQSIRLDRLRGSQLQGYLKSTASANGLAEVAVNPHEYLDAYLSDTFIDNQYTNYLVLDGVKRQYVGIYTLKSAPPSNALQSLNGLLALPLRLSIATCWKVATAKEAESFLAGARTFDEMRSMELRKLIRSAMASGGEIDGDDTPTTEVGVAAQAMKQEVRRRRAFFGSLAATVMVYADSPAQLEINMELVSRTLEQSGLVFLREREGSLSGFCVGIPGQLRDPVRWHFVEAGNVTDIAPLVTLESGDPYHPFFSDGMPEPLPPNATFKTRYNTVQYFNYHVGQLGHTLLIGPSRNGKTMLQMFLEAQFLKYPNARIFNMDKDLSCKPATLMLDGTHLNLNPGSSDLCMNPVVVAKEEAGRAWLVGWLDRLMSVRGERLTDKDIDDVAKAVSGVASIPGARLSSLLSQLPPHLQMRLIPWCEGGPWGSYFDNYEDNFSLTQITTTEVGGLISAGLTDVVNAYAEYAFYRIEQFMTGRQEHELGPTMIYFEEAGFLLDDPIFAAKARDYLMTLAKKRAFLVMTAQSPEPFINQPALGAAVRENVATIIFLPNYQATQPGLAKIYKQAFGVNDNHLELIAGATPKMEYCVYQPQVGLFRVMQAQFPKSIVSCLRSDAKSQAIFNRHYDPEDPSWKERYLDAIINA